MLNSSVIDFYRCPEQFANFDLAGSLSEGRGFFRFGHDTNCHGRSSSGPVGPRVSDSLHDALPDVSILGSRISLPFDPAEVIDSLRYEGYVDGSRAEAKPLGLIFPLLWNAYYLLRPLLPVSARKHLQKIYFDGWEQIPFPNWPVDFTVERIFEQLMILALQASGGKKIPFIWFWPEASSSCVIMTHDVETKAGRDSCSKVMDFDSAAGLKSSFQIVPEDRYQVSESFLDSIRQRGFEVNLHDCNHDGSLFREHREFLRRAKRINLYSRQYGSTGFRSAGMYRKAEWLGELDISYDMSIPNVAHLEPQRGGCCTTLPFFIGKIVELPLTTTEDYSLFHILNDYSIDLWKRQLALITARNGMASFIVHPDYVLEKRAQATYRTLLDHLNDRREQEKIWFAAPGEVDRWWRARSRMRLLPRENTWRIVGEGSQRARVAYASLQNGRVSYEVDQISIEPELCCASTAAGGSSLPKSA